VNYGEILDQVRRAGGMDVDVGLAGIWVNERYKRLAIRSGWTRRVTSLGNTVANQSAYDLPGNVAEIHELKVGSIPYARMGTQTLWDLQGSINGLDGTGGIYTPTYSSVGIDGIEFFPTPSEVAAITALISSIPDDLGGPRDVPQLPIDFHPAIAEGAMADAFAYIDENIPTADRYEARFEQAIQDLAKRRNKKVGGGPSYVQIENVHFSRGGG
jgi:hypothetical protein